jgi:type II secretory pathway pseudopilin PulG
MFCASCGGNNPDNSTFCNACGKKLNTAAPETAQSPQMPSNAKTDGKAVASLILGILSVTIFWILAGIPAVIFGHISRASIRKSMGLLKGEGIALAGLVMGYISIAAIPFILIVAAIAIPSLLRSRQVANESAAVAQLRTINTAEVTHLASKAGSYGTLSELVSEGLLDPRFETTVFGYEFSVTLSKSKSDYLATATPTSTNAGRYGYLSTSDGVIRYQTESTSTCMPCFPTGSAGSPIL